jgi:hypothetical protein
VRPLQNPVVVTVNVPFPVPDPEALPGLSEKVNEPDATCTELYVLTVSLLLKVNSPNGPAGLVKLNVPL